MLNISEAVSLALHTMVILANNTDKKLTTKEIASEIGGSEAHLSKVLQRLTKQGLVKSERGPKGGFALGKPDEDIPLLEVYEAIEGPIQPMCCLLNRDECIGSKCILGGLIQDVDRQVRGYLGVTRLSEFPSKKRRRK